MRRWLRRIILAAPMVVLLCMAVIWIRGFFVNDAMLISVDVSDEARVFIDAEVGRGAAAIRVTRVEGKPKLFYLPTGASRHELQNKKVFFPGRVAAGGFGLIWNPNTPTPSTGMHNLPNAAVYAVRFPLWLPAIAVALLTVPSVSTILKARACRMNEMLCKSCGYDLRAGHDKCPECGGESHVKLAQNS